MKRHNTSRQFQDLSIYSFKDAVAEVKPGIVFRCDHRAIYNGPRLEIGVKPPGAKSQLVRWAGWGGLLCWLVAIPYG